MKKQEKGFDFLDVYFLTYINTFCQLFSTTLSSRFLFKMAKSFKTHKADFNIFVAEVHSKELVCANISLLWQKMSSSWLLGCETLQNCSFRQAG